jgi:hypothetical protein
VQSAREPAVADTVAALLALDVEIQTDGKSLRWRPADAVGPELKQSIRANKAAIIAALTGSPDWNADRAAAVLSDCETTIDAALATASLTPPQRAVAEVLRGVVRVHAAQHDPLLWEDRNFLMMQVARWRCANNSTGDLATSGRAGAGTACGGGLTSPFLRHYGT